MIKKFRNWIYIQIYWMEIWKNITINYTKETKIGHTLVTNQSLSTGIGYGNYHLKIRTCQMEMFVLTRQYSILK